MKPPPGDGSSLPSAPPAPQVEELRRRPPWSQDPAELAPKPSETAVKKKNRLFISSHPQEGQRRIRRRRRRRNAGVTKGGSEVARVGARVGGEHPSDHHCEAGVFGSDLGTWVWIFLSGGSRKNIPRRSQAQEYRTTTA